MDYTTWKIPEQRAGASGEALPVMSLYEALQALTELPDSPDSLWYSARRLNLILTYNDGVNRAHFKHAPLSLADLIDSACADLLNCLLLMRDMSPPPTPAHHALQQILLPESQTLRTIMTFTLPDDGKQEFLSFDLPLFPPSEQSPSA